STPLFLMLAAEYLVVGPAQVLGGQHEEQGRRVDRAVIGDEHDLAARRHLAAAKLVQDLARALVRELVLLPALVGGEEPQRAPREVRIERQVLERGDDAVAA